MRRFLEVNQPRNKLGLVAKLLIDRHKMSNHYREPSMHGFYQVLEHLAKRFQRWPCFLKDRNTMSILYRGPSIYGLYQVSFHFSQAVLEENIQM